MSGDEDTTMDTKGAGAVEARAGSSAAKAAHGRLSAAMRDALWTLAQHKYGWGYESNLGNRLTIGRTMLALERRALVALVERDRLRPWQLLESARPLIAELWPVTPWGLGTYEHQPGGWTPRDGRPRTWATSRIWTSPGAKRPQAERSVARNPEGGAGR